ncbi:uncharacterized protein LOC143184760 [Calliopsis andreniformis]|uniref:uncharacterized protein LOC143184760 n=1 Tax=Calliopsis andreniformis TaxID=337506 RepID=UPI003FCC57B8
MAGVTRAIRSLSAACRKFVQNRRHSVSVRNGEHKEPRITRHWKTGNVALGILAGLVTSCSVVLYFLNQSVKAVEISITLPRYPWSFNGVFKSFDHSSLRRGWTIYKTVCHTCHSLRYVRFRELVDVTHTQEEAKAIAAEYEIQDGPDAEGNYYMRPGKLSDAVPDPYPNEEAARAANSGAYPPDLTYVVYSKKDGTNYVFSLLTGFMDPPAGVEPGDGQYFNVYFPGGSTTMAQILFPNMVDFDDGTPATESQMAKDIVEFLTWAGAPEHDTRKLLTIKCLGVGIILMAAVAHLVRRHSIHLRSRQIAFVPKRRS